MPYNTNTPFPHKTKHVQWETKLHCSGTTLNWNPGWLPVWFSIKACLRTPGLSALTHHWVQHLKHQQYMISFFFFLSFDFATMVAWLYKNAFWLCEFVHFIKYNLMTMRWLASGCFVLSRQHGRFQRNGCEKTDRLNGSEYIKVKQLSCKPMSNCKVKMCSRSNVDS